MKQHIWSHLRSVSVIAAVLVVGVVALIAPGGLSKTVYAAGCPGGYSQIAYNSAQNTDPLGNTAHTDVYACRSGNYIRYVFNIWGNNLSSPSIAYRYWVCGTYWGSTGNIAAWSYTTGAQYYGGCGPQVDNLNTSVNTPYAHYTSTYGGYFYTSL